MDVPKTKQRNIQKPLLATAIVVAAAAIAIAVALGSQGARVGSESEASLQLLVREGDLQAEVVALGTVQPLGLHQLTAQSDGQVTQVVLQPGERARAGQPILVLRNEKLQSDLTALRIRASQATSSVTMARAQAGADIASERAQLVRARSGAVYAEAEFEARQKVFQAGVVSRLQVEEARAKVGTSAADVQAGESRLVAVRRVSDARVASQLAEARIVNEELSRARAAVESLAIRAPTDGVVSQLDVELGASVSSGQTVVRFVEEKGLFARLRVPEDEAPLVKAGARVEIEAGARRLNGSVSRIHPTVKDGYVTVDVTIDGADYAGLAIDSTVKARIRGEHFPRVAYVDPAPALGDNRSMRGTVTSPEGEARPSVLQLGPRVGGRVIIVSGASAGDRVSVEPSVIRH